MSARAWLCGTVLLFFVAQGEPVIGAPAMVGVSGQTAAPAAIEVSFQNGKVSVKAREANADRLLQEIGGRTGIRVATYGVKFNSAVTVEFSALSPKEALEKVFAASGVESYAMEYIGEKSIAGPDAHRIEAVYILPSAPQESTSPGFAPVPVEELRKNLWAWQALNRSEKEREEIVRMGSVAVPGLVELMKRAADQGSEKLGIVGLLGEIGEPAALPALVQERSRMEEGNLGEIRPVYVAVQGAIAAIEAKQRFRSIPLGAMTDQEKTQVLIDLLRSDNEALAGMAAKEIVVLANVVAPGLMKAMQERKGDRLQSRGIAVLEEIGKKTGKPLDVDLLGQVLSSGGSEASVAAAEALARIGDERSRTLLLERLRHEEHNLRALGLVLSRIGENRAVAVLMERMRSPEYETNSQAYLALAYFGRPAAEQARVRLPDAAGPEKRNLFLLLGAVGERQDEGALRKYLRDPEWGSAAQGALNRIQERAQGTD